MLDVICVEGKWYFRGQDANKVESYGPWSKKEAAEKGLELYKKFVEFLEFLKTIEEE
jgi:hypothetical protein